MGFSANKEPNFVFVFQESMQKRAILATEQQIKVKLII